MDEKNLGINKGLIEIMSRVNKNYLAETFVFYNFYVYQLVAKLKLDPCWLSWGQGTKYTVRIIRIYLFNNLQMY